MFEKIQNIVFALLIFALSAGMVFRAVQIIHGEVSAVHECSTERISCLLVSGIFEQLGSFGSGMLLLGVGLFLMMLPVIGLATFIDKRIKENSAASAKRND